MRFTVHGRDYAVSITRLPLMLGGQAKQALTDFDAQTIKISDRVPRAHRRRELFHELRHVWRAARIPVGVTIEPCDDVDEADAEDAGAMNDVLIEQYENQGGTAALTRMEPPASESDSPAPPLPSIRSSVPCGFCGCAIRPSPVTLFNGPVQQDSVLKMSHRLRAMACGNCDSLTIWHERCTNEGFPLGDVLQYPSPELLRGAVARQWCRDNSPTLEFDPPTFS